jgi:hypothetical protein
LNGLEGGTVWNTVLKSVVSTIAMGAALWGWLRLMQGRSGAITTLAGLAIGTIVYCLGVILFKVPEIGAATRLIGNLFKRKAIKPESEP